MKMARIWSVSAGVLALAGMAFILGQADAGGGKGDGVVKIAAMLKKGDTAGAKAAAADYAKKNSDVEELMHLFKPAAKGGIGVGGKDGIEQTLVKIGRDTPTPAAMGKMADAYIEMGFNVAAVALVTQSLAPDKDAGKKTRKDWTQWATDMNESGLKLAAAAKSKSGADTKAAASKINAACNSCHTVFR